MCYFVYVSYISGFVTRCEGSFNTYFIIYQLLFRYPTKPILEVDGIVDFGNVVADSKTIAREISLVNHGSRAGEFHLKYAGNQPIVIMPTSGSVPPKSVQLIKVFIDHELSFISRNKLLFLCSNFS